MVPVETVSRRGPPLSRHVATVALIILLAWLFWWVHNRETHPAHRWNRAMADTSVVLLCIALVLGPVSRYLPRARRLLPWRREVGIGMFVAAGLHVWIYLYGDWNPLNPMFVPEGAITDESGLLRTPSAAANWAGLVALAYALVLAVTSNRFLQRRLGRGWKLVQQQAYTLYVLTALHVAGWLYLSYESPSGFEWWFWVAVAATSAAQFAGYVRTIRWSNSPSPERLPAKRARWSMGGRATAAKWVTVVAVWTALIVRVYTLGVDKS